MVNETNEIKENGGCHINPAVQKEYERLLGSPKELYDLIRELGIGHDDSLSRANVWEKALQTVEGREGAAQSSQKDFPSFARGQVVCVPSVW
jgi:hypothetical protein